MPMPEQWARTGTASAAAPQGIASAATAAAPAREARGKLVLRHIDREASDGRADVNTRTTP